MILCSLTIQDLFGYEGRVELRDLAPPDETRNVCVLVGRNNHGKTSLLSAIRLLFAGVTAELRREAMPRRQSSDLSYLRGDGIHWLGAFNRAAVAEGRREFGVEAELRSRVGERVVLRRTWSLDGTEHLSSRVSGAAQDARATRAWLDDIFPAHALGYFLFDGERIQDMVVDQKVETEVAMRRLFRLEPLQDLADALHDVVKEWARAEAPAARRAQMDALELELRALDIRVGQLDAEITAVERQLVETKQRLQAIDAEREQLRRRGSLEERTRLQTERKHQHEKVRSLAVALATVEVPWLPLVSAPDLVAQAREQLVAMETRRPAVLTGQIDLLDRLEPALVKRVEHSGLEAKSSVRVVGVIHEVVGTERDRLTQGTRASWSGSEAVARRALDQLDGAEARAAAAALQGYKEGLEELSRLDTAILSYESLGRDEEQRVAALETEARRLDWERERLASRLASLGTERTGQKQIRTGKLREQESVERALEAAIVSFARAQACQKVEDFLPAFLARTHEHRRHHVEAGMRVMFKELFSSTRDTVRQVRLDPDLGVTCENDAGVVVPPASLSAGTRQLIAVSLLWSLTENAGLDLPVVIDTPLARLDKGHQERVLQIYLPSAGRQVFLIPHDAELPPERHALIADRIYRSGQIVQTNGRSRVVWND